LVRASELASPRAHVGQAEAIGTNAKQTTSIRSRIDEPVMNRQSPPNGVEAEFQSLNTFVLTLRAGASKIFPCRTRTKMTYASANKHSGSLRNL